MCKQNIENKKKHRGICATCLSSIKLHPLLDSLPLNALSFQFYEEEKKKREKKNEKRRRIRKQRKEEKQRDKKNGKRYKNIKKNIDNMFN